jgi:hypothetical protein
VRFPSTKIFKREEIRWRNKKIPRREFWTK